MLEKNSIINVLNISKCLRSKYEIKDFILMPKSYHPELNEYGWWTPDLQFKLEKQMLSDGWTFLLYQQKSISFWIGKIDGPDHGVTYYGKFPGVFSFLDRVAFQLKRHLSIPK